MAGKVRHQLGATTGQDVNHAGGHVTDGECLGECDGGERRPLARKQDCNVSASQHACESRHKSEQWRTLWRNDRHNTRWLRDGEDEVRRSDRVCAAQDGGDLIWPACEPNESVDTRRNLLCRLRLAVAVRHQVVAELRSATLHQLCDAVENLSAQRCVARRPAWCRAARRLHRFAEILARCARNVGAPASSKLEHVGATRLTARKGAADIELRCAANFESCVIRRRDCSDQWALTLSSALLPTLLPHQELLRYAWSPCRPPSRP
jgi:hypothetical protein